MPGRVAARFIDWLLLGMPFVLLVAIAINRAKSHGNVYGQGLVRVVVTVVVNLGAAAYEVGLTAWRGQTVGKIALGLQVVDAKTGAVPGWRQAFVRYIPLYVPGLVLPAFGVRWGESVVGLLLLVSILADRNRRGLHDKAAGTIVVER
jgi:uncharacterized RDD family membrane protein YckC